ncbi:MAG: S-layer family protein [Lachnospiraceae bacterium]|nr:S-layer family protein [Lachnospiraceae bacterium]
MKNSIFVQAANFLHERRDNRRWQAVVICLAIVVVCTTALGLSKRGQALARGEDVLDCRFVVHEHGEGCYDENENLICTMADYVFHEHDESCYDADEELICRLPEIKEHVHTDDCFTSEDLLICGEEENAGAEESTENMENPLADAISVEDIETADAVAYADEDIAVYDDTISGGGELICGYAEHTHDGSCYETVVVSSGQDEVRETFICTQAEHTHDDSCLDEEGNLVCAQEEHSHGSDCYEYETIPGEDEVSEILVCGQEEHIHGDECYSAGTATDTTDPGSTDTAEPDVAEPDSTENTEGVHVHTEACYKTVRKLICGEKAAHIHDDSCYDNNGIAVCGAPYVESVETHVHDKECFKSGDADDMEYSKSYSNDDIVVTAVYKKSANIPVEAKLDVEQIIIEENDREEYTQRLETVLEQDETPAMLLSLRFSTDDEMFIPEDTISLTVEFLNDNIYAEGDMAKVASITEDGAEAIISANIDDTHSVTFDVDELTDLAFIAYEEKEARTLTYEGADYIVTVALGEETLVPEDAELVVEQITEENDPEAYESCYDRLEEAEGMLDENEMPALLLNMGIYAEGNEIVPDETMDVTVQFLNREIYFEGDAVKAAHLTADGIELLAASAIDEEVSTTFTVDTLAEFAFITDGDIRTLTAEGEDFIVAVRFGPSARIPKDAQLVAKRITEENDPEQFTTREDQLQDEITDELIALGALFDISFYDAEGMEIEPQDVVDVKIQLLDKKDVEEADSVKVAHFVEDEETAEESIEIIEDADVSKDGDGSLSTTFQTESFSTFAVTVNGQVNSASTLRKAFALAQQGSNDNSTVRLEGDIVFTNNKDEADDPKGGAIPINQGKTVTLDLNGYTITVDSSNNNVSLFDIGGNLYIQDSPRDGVTRSVTKNAEEAKAPTFTYDNSNNLHHLDAMTCSVTESQVIDSSRGVTQETTYTYTVTGHGAIVGTNQNGVKNESPLLYVKAGTLGISGGVIVGDTGNRAVEMRYGGDWQVGLTATMTLNECYLVGCTAISKLAASEIGGGAIYCGDSGTINMNDGAIISGNTARRGGGVYVISADGGNSLVNITGGYITNNMATFNDSGRNYGDGGGGIDVNNAAIEMTGGYITGNKTYAGGAGIALSGRKQWRATKIINGTIASNYCVGYHGEGGGIALYDESIIEINGKDAEGKGLGKVYITNNEVGGVADWGGGGLFVGRDSSATLFDALITGNSADGFGGGLGGCSTGRIVEVNSSTRGAAIFDNSAAGHQYAGDSTKNEDHEYSHNTPTFWERDDRGRYYFQDLFSVLFTTVDNTMLGGGSEHWDGTVDGVRVSVNETVWQSSYLSGLTAFPNDTDKTRAEGLAAVYINGNYSAVHGGGIMCNGIMVIGENKGQIEIITAMELTGTKKLIGSNGNIPLTNDQAGQFSFSVYAGAAYQGPHTHKAECHVDNDNTKALICGLEEGEPVFEQHEHIPPTDKYGNENPNSCYRKLTDTAGGKEWELTCGKGVVVKGTNGTEVITGNDPDTGNVTTTAYDPQTISFDSLLTFDLQRELGKKKEDITTDDKYEYWYYIKEDDATEASANAEIERDRTVYCMVVTVQKKDYGLIGLSNIRKYYDDIVGVRVYKTIKGADGKWNWDENPVYTNGLMHNQYHAIKINMDDFSDNKAAFTNKKTNVKRIEVRKSWDYDYGLDKPEWNKEDEIEWVSMALFWKGGYGYNDVAYGPGDKDENGNSLEGQTTPWKNEIKEWGGVRLDRLYLSKANNWTASWENLPDNFPIDNVEVREIDIKYTDEKWAHWWMDQEAIDGLHLTLTDRIDPATWAFVPKYTYTSEGDTAKVVALNIPKTFGISFTKIGYKGTDDKLVGNGKEGAVYGAKFEIYQWIVGEDNVGYWANDPMVFEQVNDGYSYIRNGIVTDRRTVTQLVTNIYGKINISNLWYSKFLIREVEAPVGYKPIHDHVVDYTGVTATQKVYCVMPDGDLKQNGVDDYICEVFPELDSWINVPADRGSDSFDYADDVLIFKMIDPEDKYELPETGGKGTIYISILGALSFFGIATLMFYITYRRRREGLRR